MSENILFILGKDAKKFIEEMSKPKFIPTAELNRIKSNYNLINSKRVELDTDNLKPLPSAYKLSALRNAESYEKKVLAREELIKELARQLNEGYEALIIKK